MSRSDAVVEAAFPFPAEVAELAGIGNLVEPLGGDSVADRDIAFFPEGVIGQRVGLQIPAHVLVGPLQNGQEFPAGVLTAENLLLLPVL